MSSEVARPITLSLLRGFSLRIGGRLVPLAWSVQRLVAFLAIKAQPLTRAYVAGTLWPDVGTGRANANLRSSLWRAQQSCPRLIVASSQQMALAADVVVDVRRAVARAYLLLDRSQPCDDIMNVATRSDLSAQLLPDWYQDDWVLIEREQYHHLRLHALEALCERLTTAGRYGEAVAAGLLAVAAEPLRESAHLALVKAHLAEGNRWEALLQYERCRRLLQEELGVEPSQRLRELLPVRAHRSAGARAAHQLAAAAFPACID